MTTPLPPHLSEATFSRALTRFAEIVGREWVLSTPQDRHTYLDAYAVGSGHEHMPAAAVAPASVEEVQALLRVANEFKVPLWQISRGKNLGYGAAAPVMPGCVVLDLSRMNRILEVNEKHGYCLLEPGVGFYDLYNYLREHNIPLWMSTPGNAWGSVVGNALERGLGYTPYGDHASKICGMEVVLPSGELVRTGLGAMGGNVAWQNYQYGFGPSWDQMFVQSNFGVVTKMGLWLMPEPEMTLQAQIYLPREDDIAWAIDELGELRLRDVIRHPFVFGNYLHDAAALTQRSEWYEGEGALPDSVIEQIIRHFNIGWWKFRVALFGYEEEVRAQEKVVRAALEPQLGSELNFTSWRRGDPLEQAAARAPSVFALQIVNWHGGRGGHIGFSPVMPTDGQLALAQVKRMKARYAEFGLDYYTSFTMGQRHINNVNLILYNRDDERMVQNADALFRTLITDAQQAGYAEYRTHISYMDPVAASFDFNDHALLRLNEAVKDTLDPNGILAPGKSGIWPRQYRDQQRGSEAAARYARKEV